MKKFMKAFADTLAKVSFLSALSFLSHRFHNSRKISYNFWVFWLDMHSILHLKPNLGNFMGSNKL